MKPLIAASLAGVLLLPVVSSAQPGSERITRAQVRDEILKLEKVGYMPGNYDPQYPEQLQAALARLEAQGGAAQPDSAGAMPAR
jgi:hypothetical protein